MAVDGSFCLESELWRFLHRCPKLKSVPCFVSLLKKVDKIREEEVVVAVGQLVLHPNYTIPLLGCFRPIAQKIVQRTVGLLRMVPNLREDSDNYMEEFEEDGFLREDESVDCSEIANIIDVYVLRGKCLRLHELACLAFCRALDLIPLLLGDILIYFKASPAPFERIMQCRSVSNALPTVPNQLLLDVVKASYRFLELEPEVFTTLWDWSCMLDLVQQPMVDDAVPSNIILDLRWCSIAILKVVLRLSSRASAKLGLDSEDALPSYLRWREFCTDVMLEKGGWYLESCAEEAEAMVGTKRKRRGGGSLLRCSSMPNEIDPSNQIGMSVTGIPGTPFVLTSAMTQSFEMASLAVNQRWPVLLYGPPGCGKTALTKNLAHRYGCKVLSIHMDDQIDGKTLLGSYVCTDQPGEFTWQPGSLTQAVLNGFWVVFEDLDKAPHDILSILLPLLEGSVTFSTGHGEAVRVSQNFRLFSTVTSSNPDTSRFTEGRNSLGAVWRKVTIVPPSKQDLIQIVLEWYPELKDLAQKLIETFEKVNHRRSELGFTASSSYNDRFTLRDLLKLCKRVASLRDLSEHEKHESICKEAVDVFASFSTSAENRLAIMKEIAEFWKVAAAETLYLVNKPIIKDLEFEFQVGRATLRHPKIAFNRGRKPFVELRASIHALEKVVCSVIHNEPVLLVGETGTGKTTLVQTLATRLGQKLTVMNLSQQSDVADLLGGFKPMDALPICGPLYDEFVNLFSNSFPSQGNERFCIHMRELFNKKKWNMLLNGFGQGVKKILHIGMSSSGKKRKRPLSKQLLQRWEFFSKKLERAHAQVRASNGMVFSFVEGAFATALKNGEWVLLDEVNLAPPEILQRIVGVLEDEKGSLCLSERGDIDYVCRHSNFRMFACMNPATDAGKRELPTSLRSRFTEYFVDDKLDDQDLVLFINQFMYEDPSLRRLVSNIVEFYREAKNSENMLQDGANQKPHYSLRSLYRALEYVKKGKTRFGLEKSIYDGFCMFFMNSLDDTSAKLMKSLICQKVLGGKTPQQLPYHSYLMGSDPFEADDGILGSYVVTESVNEHLKNLARAIFIQRYPVLLQGPTSSGKTSLVWYLAAKIGREFVRINNHEHTDLQEYLGSYITDTSGKLVFQEGALVKAVRKGHWVVLDELNLAPSDVLEALNRLLDDNRELFVPELQENIRAHPNFMLFATQNPPLAYAGRKVLSRAFRNRFVEIHVDEIPLQELTEILGKRCKIPQSYAKKMVDVMKELQSQRQSSKIFAGKHGFVTPRDLFRWAGRFRTYGNSIEDLAYDGYYLLAERLRDDAEKAVVKDVLERKLTIKLSDDNLYKQDGNKVSVHPENMEKIIWTKSLLRMYFLVERCYKMREPVLLVGETGGGKTTVCQLLGIMFGSKLHVLNCHQYTETSDFIGGFYPVRERPQISLEYQNLCDKLDKSEAYRHYPEDTKIVKDINEASKTLKMLSGIIKSYKDGSVTHAEVTVNEIGYIEKIYVDMCELQQKWQTIFMWQDGPLVEAMKKGDMFLVDEISLADDSVLERLNSVLEPERKLSMAEKGGSDLENIIAHPNFFILATMNPGGDYGKKELSPALRNRFTEIWVPSVSDADELKSIARERISNTEPAHIVDVMLKFWEWFNLLQTGRLLTVRDLLSWVSFINVTNKSLMAESALVHGAFLVLLDGLSLGTNVSKVEAADLRVKCFDFLLETLKEYNTSLDLSSLDKLDFYGWSNPGSLSVVSNTTDDMECDSDFGMHPFYIKKGTECIDAHGFEFLAPTTRRNTLRVLRAMQLNKPVLLEGSPGVGKTSLIVALGKFSGHAVVRINLSEQTDIMDLLGSDLPVESDEGIRFSWSDGILLQALKNGSWVLLDELNLAPQSVLEGLNAILDHRAEVFIPELGQSFKCPTSFRVFACQNPSYQGGGRKGLPKSFLNRFTKVYVDELVDEDYVSICSSLFPSIETSLLSKLVDFNKRLHQDTMLYNKFGQDGSPWEFNLRDVIRSCQIIQGASEKSKYYCFLSSIYLQRMRTPTDRTQVMKLYEEIFRVKPFVNPYPGVKLNPDAVIVGDVTIERSMCQSSSGMSSNYNNLKILPGSRHCLEAMGQCVKHQWLCILVGPPSSGKTSLVRLFSELTGNVLNELNLSSSTDISELLGCFEQYNSSRHYHLAIARVERYMNEYCNLQTEYSLNSFVTKQWLAFVSNINKSATSIDIHSIRRLVEIIEHLKMEVDNKQTLSSLSWSCKDLDSTLNMIKKLEENHQKRQQSVKFEWVTGVLIKAIENGEWVILENANLCNPTVLDRINSLVEQAGSITINECGTVEGKPVVIHPHPKFRMFFTVNPSYGEVSRAMRNRGVEIYLMQPFWLLDKKSLDEIELREVKRFIVLSGIPVGRLVQMMATAHIYAKREGSHINVSITYLELSRWVQLFQRLITDGNRPAWSLQISWKHTYLSSLGEGEGKEIVSQAAGLYLSVSEIYEFTLSEDCLLCLPGGWPTPLKLTNYVSYSREANVRQNIMYLESMGSQIASRMYSDALNGGSKGKKLSFAGGSRMIHLMDATVLHRLMFPEDLDSGIVVNCGAQSKLDLVLTEQKLSFAADWAIEQATESDFRLYISWFEWFGSRLQPDYSFFNLFSDLLKKELKHSIWKRIFQLQSAFMSPSAIDNDSTSLPILSMELIDVYPCVGLLRRSLQQWSKEEGYNRDSKTQPFEDVLSSLRRLEEKVLDFLVESPSFDVLFKSYSDLLEHHILFWNSLISPQTECRLISWRSLLKDAVKLRGTFPAEVEDFQSNCSFVSKLDGRSSLSLNSRKSMLWKRGGHPILPSSADVYQKQSQLSSLCEKEWPRKSKFMKLDGGGPDDVTVGVALFSDVKLRVHAMEGVCMSYIISQADDNDSETSQKLEEMYQLLSERLESDRQTLVVKSASSKLASWPCCVFTSDVLCTKSGTECWLNTQPIVDETSLCLDLELLQHLTKITVVDSEKKHNALLKFSGLVESSLKFSLDNASRPLTDFLPHQKILWILGAWESVGGATENVSSFVLEMWFRWHATLWEPCPMIAETLKKDDVYGTILPHKLFWPAKLAMVDQILQNASIRDYHMHNFKIRAASRNIWLSSANMINSHGLLLSVARSFFQQIIYAHKRSFTDSIYAKIRATLHSIEESANKVEDMKLLVSLLASSNHHAFKFLVPSYIEPLLSEIYTTCTSNDIKRLGCALLRIGGLRYNLLIRCDNLDPTFKYSIKYSELTEKIALLEIENQVREECTYLVGNIHQREDESYRTNLLAKLKAERRTLQRKMVFRPNPGKFKELKRRCDEFLVSVTAAVEQLSNVNNLKIEEVTKQVNWQETMSWFIDRSNEYTEFTDITEPVRVAVYEMKLGLSLIFSGLLCKGNVANRQQDMESILSMIYKFVRFPRVCAKNVVSTNVERQPKISTRDIEFPMGIEEIDMNMLQNIIELPFKVSVYHNVLARIKDSAADARFLGFSSFERLHEIFDEVASLWVKNRATKQTDNESKGQQFKFRARAFKIESIIDIDVSNFATLLANDSFSEWQIFLAEQLDEKMIVNEESGALEQDFNAQESDLVGIVNIHNQLFGSVDLVQRPGNIQVSDMDRLSSFVNSYTLGVKMARDMKGSFTSCFDAKVAPEHLLRLCMEHDDKFIHLDNKSTRAYNFYKDSNSPIMSKLVEPVTVLKQRILFLMKEWNDHPALQKVAQVIDMILALPLDTPLAKAVSALEFLLDKVRILHTTVAKIPLSDQLEPIRALLSSWRRLEFDSWPALLDGVESQFETNAGKLWFPLYSVFQQSHTADIDQYNSLMIKSLDEFFKTSSIGEFKRQLQLLLSLHGHIGSSMNWRSYTSPCSEENVKILYNTFGYYVQLLPRILEYTEANRRSIEKELNELLKMASWDRIDTVKTARPKLRKIVRKYTDILQQPLMEFLGQESTRTMVMPVQGQKPMNMIDSYEVIRTLLDIVCNETQLRSEHSSVWFTDWWKNLKSVGEIVDGVKDNLTSQSSSLINWERRSQLWDTIENLCRDLIYCGELWEDEKKKLGKRRAFSDLLMLLDSCGLSRHRTSLEGQDEKSSHSWLLQPSYDVQHLLLTQSDHHCSKNVDDSSLEMTWKSANRYYFKSIASIQSLRKICRERHKDLSLEQVNRSGSYVDHLIEIQQEQRAVAYDFSKKLKCLRQNIWPLSNLVRDSSLIKNQHATFNCMWQQKQLFDGFFTLMYEEHLLLQKVQNNHLSTCCSGIKDGTEKIRLLIQEALPDFQKSKNLLDFHLLGNHEDITMVGIALHPFGVTKEMQQLVSDNFELINRFEKNLSAVTVEQSVVEQILLGHFKDLLSKAYDAEKIYSSLQEKKLPDGKNMNELKSEFDVAHKRMYEDILGIFKNIGSSNHNYALTEEEMLKNMTKWKILFEKDTENLQLDLICEDVLRTIQSAGELLNYCGDEYPGISSSVFEKLRNVHLLLDTILAFGDNLLQDFLVIHSVVSKVTCALANIFASLFTKGFGSAENQENDTVEEGTQDAHGTGMGEGVGLNDVSNQIEDEDQLLGTSSEMPNETESNMPSETERGIEMEQDFDGDAFSVSEDDEDDENEDDNEDDEQQLDSAMGEVGDNSDVVDEKLGENNEDDKNNKENEKYENGPSVKDKSSQDDELRANEDDSAATEENGVDLDDAKESNENGDDENGNAEGDDENGDEEGVEDMNIDKDDASLDPSGVDPECENDKDTQVDEIEATEPMEDGESEDMNDDFEGNEVEKEANSEHSADDDAEPANADGNCLENENDNETDFVQEFPQTTLNNNNNDSNNNTAQSAGQSVPNLSDMAPNDRNSNFGESENDLAPTSGQPNGSSDLEITVADAANGQKLSDEQYNSNSQKTGSEESLLNQRAQPNPYRSIGDALKGWKERVKVTIDLDAQKDESNDLLMEENADEYGYTAAEGTAQALGPATADQTLENIGNQDDHDDMERDIIANTTAETDTENTISEAAGPIRNSAVETVINHGEENVQRVADLGNGIGEPMEVDDHDMRSGLSDSLVSVNRSLDMHHQIGMFPMNDDEANNGFEPSNDDDRDAAAAIWRRYEMLTTRLSQELAEQLRLVMEPNLASKLQGDYKTGKRINMKKVIPYVASHYRKDKIWMRRTRPSKRDYQVVIAVDDSASMSERHCGNFAKQALVTVCRAMSQLEVGNLAVTSFGKKGNIQLLHDFDQPFTPETGIKMISSFTFQQENKFPDDPMVDLLKYLDNMLDDAVMKARLPSGCNPLQQLVLIIADGRFTENKKILKRYVRDILSKKRMVAFLILDNPNESIMDSKEWPEVTPLGKDNSNFIMKSALDSFPFPYYVVLKNIEALPRTLADLLRQWFELMQSSGE